MALEDQKATDRRALAERVQDALVRARRETVVNERLWREGRGWNWHAGATEAQRQAEESRLRERSKNEIDNLMAFEEIAALMRPLGQELAIAADVLADTAARSLEGRTMEGEAQGRPVPLRPRGRDVAGGQWFGPSPRHNLGTNGPERDAAVEV